MGREKDTFEQILCLLPEGWEAKARELGALRRARKIKTPAALLRLILLYLTEGKSFAGTSAIARLSGEAELSKEVKNNQEEMEIAYNKLILLFNYSITDFEEVRKRLKLLMEKYNRIYELLMNGLYKMQEYNTYPEDRKIDVSGLKKQSDEMINECTDLLGDKRLDGVFMSGINHFIRKEVHAIREFSIKL